MLAHKRSASPNSPDPSEPKRPRSEATSLHAWLHPSAPPLILSHSPPLHQGSSTFLSFTISFVPPSHITNETNLAKEVRRIVRELDVVSRVGAEVMQAGEGAFEDGEGRAPARGNGRDRAREPDHRMWACRALCLKDGKNGTEGEEAYQLIESFNDDGEKFGGERILKVLKEQNAVDVITICCRWYGGDMIGPIRFQHIATTVQTSLQLLLTVVQLRDLRAVLEGLDEDIAAMRTSLATGASSPAAPVASTKGKYDAINDVAKLERQIAAKEKTVALLVKKASSSQAS